MRQISTRPRTAAPRRSAPRPPPGGARSCAATARADASRARVDAPGPPLRARIAPRARRHASARDAAPARAHASRARADARTASSLADGSGAAQQHDLRAPPHAVAVALGLVHDQAGRLQVVEPALHAAPVRAHEPRPLRATARNRPPADHRRQPHDELRDRRRVPRRPLRVTEPEQVALDRVRARLQPIVARRRAAARTTRPAEQRAHDQAARLSAAAARSPADTNDATTSDEWRMRVQRHRQRPQAPRQHEALRTRTDARGTAGDRPDRRATRSSARRTRPLKRGWRSVRRTATVRKSRHMWAPSPRASAEWPEGRRRRPGGYPVFFVPRHGREGGPRERGRGEEHAPPNREQAATDLLPTPPTRPARSGFRVRGRFAPQNDKSRCTGTEFVVLRNGFDSGDGGN